MQILSYYRKRYHLIIFKGDKDMKTINSTEVIANSKFNRFHLGLLLWSFIIILFDGYDLVVYGTVVPSLIE